MARRERTAMSSNPATWLMLIHRIPAKPDYLRVKIGRQLWQLGAVAIKNSVYALPAAPDVRSRVSAVAHEIVNQGGDAIVCESQLIDGLTDGAVEDLLREARDSEYATIAAEAKRLADGLRGKRAVPESRRRRAGQAHERLRTRFEQVVARDVFGARGREIALNLLSLLEDRVQGVDETESDEAKALDPPRGAIWVTRSGVMVDRIASAWLIRRFIDPTARFKFVMSRGYRPREGEIRFDMAAAEHTHRDGRCTFEGLIQSFRLHDSALNPIAEIVHDLDLDDEKHRRSEAPGVGRMIVGLAIAHKDDETRLVHGGTLFDTLYESFKRQSR
jgi:hypothetical protein